MAGTHREAALLCARRFGLEGIIEIDDLVARPEVDVVYIATPPFLHHPQAMPALRNGKHVICEKPLAMTLEQADEMVSTAKDKGLVMVADLMQRYNPMYDKVRMLVQEELLGKPLHGYFENYAVDEGLGPQHWFWERDKSGGIFVEHGVHFFDMFTGWLGPGEVVAAQVGRRPGAEQIEEQVSCTVRHANGALVNHFHSFTQPSALDRQELRILFERGDITLYEWVPTVMKMQGVADEATMRRIVDLFPGGQLDIVKTLCGDERRMGGRHQQFDVAQVFDFSYGLGVMKGHRYGEELRGLFADQVAYILDPGVEREVTEANGRDSLALALAADALAHADGGR
jgi:predicted dehydrogenase